MTKSSASVRSSLRSAAVPWAVSRVVIVAAMLVARWRAGSSPLSHAGAAARAAQGVGAWDAGWYRAIALHGYASLGEQSTRFFPVWPGMLRGLHLLGVPVLWSMAIATSLLWLGALVAIDRLGSAAGLSGTVRSTSLWLIALWPGAIATVLGYAEPLLVLLVACSLALVLGAGDRASTWSWRWVVAGALGGVAAATRPVGILLVLPFALEAWRQRPRGAAALGSRLVGIGGPVIGLGSYLAWCRHQFGDALLPLRIQTQATHHGGLTNPVSGLVGDVRLALDHHLSDVLHLPFVLIAILLCILAFRRVALSLAVYSAAVVVVALSGHNLDSFERYVLAAPGVFFAGATLLANRTLKVVILVGLGGALFAYSALALGNVVVP